jgi:hypothetical protein
VAVAEGQERDLLAHEHLLHDDLAAGRAELGVDHDLLEGVDRVLHRAADDHALARGQAVGLDDDGRALFLDEGLGPREVVEHGEVRGGHAGLEHDRLGESLAALELGRIGARPEAGPVGVGHHVGDAQGERQLRAGHDQTDALARATKCASAAVSSSLMATFSASPAVPPLPGAQ